MSTATKERTPINGVDVPTLFATIDAVRGAPEAAQFQFRATNRWLRGTHSRTTIDTFFGVGAEQEHPRPFILEGDHPEVLTGADAAPNPVESLLHALAICLTAGIGNIASARGIELESVESRIEGDIDLQGLLGLSDEVRNGCQQIRVTFRLEGDATDEELAQVVEQSRARSAVFDMLTSSVPIDITVATD